MRDWRMEVRRRLASGGLPGAAEADIVEELAQHLEDRFTELRARGTNEADAERMVLEELEDETSLGESVRGTAGTTVAPVPIGIDVRESRLQGMVSDVRVGARMLRRAPGFTIVATLLIALAIGANAAIFSVLNAVLLRPLPGAADPAQLVAVYTSDFSGPRFGASSLPDVEAMREADVLAGLAAYSPRPFSVSIDGRAAQLLGEVVTPDYFQVLGVRPAAGRFFVADEAGAPGTSSVAVISHAFWQNRLHGAPDVIGRELRVNGLVLTIVGVADPAFQGMLRGVRGELWVPTSAPAALVGTHLDSRGSRGMLVIARLGGDATVAAVQQRLNALAARLHAEFPAAWTDVNDRSRVLTVLPESEARVPRAARNTVLGMFALLTVVVAVVLLIACSNVANLMLTRASARRAEMGVRIALGATRGRIVRQLLAESMLLAGLGGSVGLLLAWLLTRALASVRLPGVPLALDVAPDGRVVVFALLVTLITGVLFGLVPALHASRAPAPLMKDGLRAGVRMRTRNVLVIVQVAASVVLLAGGALFLRSLMAAQRVDIGIEADGMALMDIDLATEGHSPEQAQQFFTQLRERVAALPGVTSATLAQRVPLGMGWARRSIVVEGYTPGPGEDMEFPFNAVSDGYFEAMGIPLLAGRGFTPADRAGAPQVVVVNETFARRFWPGGGALGARIGLLGPEGPRAEVVGIVPDGKYRSLTEDPTPYFYYPWAQLPASAMVLQVRTGLDPARIASSLRAEVRALAPGIAMPEVVTLRSRVALATLPQRIAAFALGILGVLALGIAAIGLYGVISYVVVQRTREFGIRTALGADPGAVRRMVVGQGVRLAIIGIVIGTAASLGLARLLRSMLLVSPADPPALAAAAAVLALVAVLASWIPARRATRLDPLLALRSE
jgi:predicted permease